MENRIKKFAVDSANSEVSDALQNLIKKSGRTDDLSRGLLVTL